MTIPLDVKLSLNESAIQINAVSLTFGQRFRKSSLSPGKKLPSPNIKIASLQTLLHPDKFSEDSAEHLDRLLHPLLPILLQSDKSRILSFSKDEMAVIIESDTHSPQPAKDK